MGLFVVSGKCKTIYTFNIILIYVRGAHTGKIWIFLLL